MGEGVVGCEGFAFEANCGGCGGLVTHPMLRILEVVVGLACCYLGDGTIPGDWLVGIQGELVFRGGTLGLLPEAHQHGWSGDSYPNRRIQLIPVPFQPCWCYPLGAGYGGEH